MIKPLTKTELLALRHKEKRYEQYMLISMLAMLVGSLVALGLFYTYGVQIFNITSPLFLIMILCMLYWGHRLKHMMYEFQEGEWNLPDAWHLDPVLYAYFWGVKDSGREKPSVADELRIERYVSTCVHS